MVWKEVTENFQLMNAIIYLILFIYIIVINLVVYKCFYFKK